MIKAVAVTFLTLTLATGVADPSCKEGQHRKVNPAPNPDPAPSRKGIGNVSITFWLDQDPHRTVTAYNYGTGYKSKRCDNDCHWTVTTKPGQVVTVSTDYYHIGQKGWLKITVIQNNNGRILCHDNNDKDRGAGVSCTGTVVI